ncbi:hypothetical protein Pla123a_18230 [Posidoniimonas polymericola]|uniref:Uncharacterized protein n=1 Tax=Posidoniimonas polymericola TaxID=2528002 RepID=A0A5C5YTG5_9BACT|nr:hypothetical protein [Posidoniimonas polymericola]TWT78023.1 hypothetical protein Pla123a_18230 [Posidoniimonas polymericola]
MSIGPMGGVLGSAAGAPLSQTKGSETERSAREGAAQDKRVDADNHADAASGIGTTEEDQATEDRDADGRRMWEAPPDGEHDADEHSSPDDQHASEQPREPRRVRDPKGDAGNQLDLLG